MLLYLAAIAYLPSPAHLSPRASVGFHRAAAIRLSDETPPEDWRELRARLVAKERAEDMAAVGDDDEPGTGYVYESPLIEQGSVILGGTLQDFGFALRQQYFHKSVMLLLQHDEGFTKGIILNRPSAYEVDGWRVWFGGDVAEGAMFRGADDAKGEREIIALHALNTTLATRLSMPVIKGVSYTTLEGAQALVEEGEASKSDFWVFVGYAGWAPQQLEGEVERDSWFLASADSGTLLKELLRQGTDLPPPSSGVLPGDGLATWEKLMESIGRVDQVESSRGSLADRMLSEWCRVRLVPPALKSADEPSGEADVAGSTIVEVGTVLRSGEPASRFVLSDQFLHKALLLVVHELPDGTAVCVVLNRPTANLVQLHSDGEPRRCVSFGGDGRLRGSGLGIDANGLMWLCQRPTLQNLALATMGTPIGASGVQRVPALEAAEQIKDGVMKLDDFLLVSGLVCFEPDELREMLANGELHTVPRPASLWPRVWDLADAKSVEDDVYSEGGALLSDGTGVWWAAAQLDDSGRDEDEQDGDTEKDSLDALLSGLQSMPPAHIADEALDDWLKFFAGHRGRDLL